jgi:hypothetical protein
MVAFIGSFSQDDLRARRAFGQAFIDLFVQDCLRARRDFDFKLLTSSVPAGLGAGERPPGLMAFIGLFFQDGARAWRDFGFKLLTPSVPVQRTKKLNSEPSNGHLAMLATSACSSRMAYGLGATSASSCGPPRSRLRRPRH